MLYTPAPALLHILDPGFRNTLSTRIVASTPVSKYGRSSEKFTTGSGIRSARNVSGLRLRPTAIITN